MGLLAGAGQALHYVEPDHLGTPRAVIDRTRDVAIWTWDAKSEAFGNSAPNQDPDLDGAAFVFNLRFPGQRYDAATGLNYNYFRDYDPASGRYVQSDPIGLRGGVNTYAYAGGNPISRTDPSGLATVVIHGGPTAGNPFGHVAIAVTGSGIYSFGTGTQLGSSVTNYLQQQATYRNSTAFIISTTPQQEAAILAQLQSYKDNLPPVPSADSSDTCATRTNSALRQAGLYDPSNPYSWMYSSPLPESSAMIGGFYGSATIVIPMGATEIHMVLNQFNP